MDVTSNMAQDTLAKDSIAKDSIAKDTIVALLADLFFAPRFADLVGREGGTPIIVESPSAFVDAVDGNFPVLALVDLGVAGDWEDAIRRIKLRPHTRQVPIYAFGSHVDTATLQRARAAGADHAWARSRMMEEMPALIARHLHPPVIYPDGWDAPLSEAALRGVEEFNHGEFHEQHEWFEKAWIEEPRPIREMYQGILQVGLAYYQIQHANWNGAIKMFRRGLPRLRTLPPVCQGIDIASFRADAERIHAEVTALGAARIGEFVVGAFPKIAMKS